MDEPSNPLLMEQIPQTVDQLLECIAKLFHCMTGPPMAYFEIPQAPRDPQPIDLTMEKAHGDLEQLRYVTLAWCADLPPSPGVEALLVMEMLVPFLDARRQVNEHGGTPLLFWRRPLLLEADSKRSRLTCRVVIPGANLQAYAHGEGEIIPRL